MLARIHTRTSPDIHVPTADVSGIPGACMSYKPAKYPRLVVIRYGCKLTGFPADEMPFVNLSDKALGGIKSLRRLRELWDSGKLKFERATEEDLRAAAEDPASVLPDGGRCLTLPKPDKVTMHPPKQLVMHPFDLSSVGVEDPESESELEGESEGESKKRKREQAQRSDVKKARVRPVTNPTNKPLRRAKPGVKSERVVLDLDDDEPATKRPCIDRYVLVSDPVNTFVRKAAP